MRVETLKPQVNASQLSLSSLVARWAKAQLSQPTKAQLAAKAAAKAAEAVNARSRNLVSGKSGKPKSAQAQPGGPARKLGLGSDVTASCQEILASFRNTWKDKLAEEPPAEPAQEAKQADPLDQA